MRGRKAEAIKDLEQYDFDKLSKTQGNARKRYLAFAHIRDGKSFTEAAAAIRIKLRTLMNWVKRFKERGIDGLVDQAAWYTTKRLQKFTNLTLLPLPPASPELNPTEQVWQTFRDMYLANRCYKDYDDIVQACCDAWNRWVDIPSNVTKLSSRSWANL